MHFPIARPIPSVSASLSYARIITIVALVCCTVAAGSAHATPQSDLASALSAAGVTDVSQVTAETFLKSLNAVLLRAKPRDLASYVTAAMELRPDLSSKIVFAGVRAAVRGDREKANSAVARIVKDAIAAHPESSVEIAKAAVTAFPQFRETILGASAGAPLADRTAIFNATVNGSRFAANHLQGNGHGGGRSEPDEDDDDDVISPERPPSPR